MPKVADILQTAKGFDLLKEVETLLCDDFGVDTAKLFLMRSEELSAQNYEKIYADIERLKSGYPLAYLRGRADFYGLEFIVNKNVLIPRRETEILVRETLDCIQNLLKDQPRVSLVELGVGSGCISVSIAKNNDRVTVYGVEKSKEALEVAKENVKKHGVEDIVELSMGDLLNGVDKGFDILVANLPYVDESLELGPGVREFEPHCALFADEGGLALYRQTLEQLHEKGLKPRCILFEIGFDQGARALAMCEALMPDYTVEIVKDLENRDRVVKMVSLT